jgi:hypothetical protein
MGVSIDQPWKEDGTGKFMDRSSEMFTEVLETANCIDASIFNCNGSTFDRGAVYRQKI